MSVYTIHYAPIYYSCKTYNSLSEVEEDLEEVNQRIAKIHSDLRTLVFMTEPNKFKSENETADYYLDNQFEELYESLEEEFIERYKLEILKSNWNSCHNKDGLGINPPEEVYNSTYIDGDFVFTEKYPTKESLLG